MNIAVNRKSVNQGCPDGVGRWLFEDFLFAESVFGRAEVTYQSQAVRRRSEDGCPGFFADPWDITIYGAEVEDVIIFDDDDKVIPLTLEQVEEAKKAVLEAFEDIKPNVVQHVRSEQ